MQAVPPVQSEAEAEPPGSTPLDLSILPMFQALFGSAVEQQQQASALAIASADMGSAHPEHDALKPADGVMPEATGLEDQGQASSEARQQQQTPAEPLQVLTDMAGLSATPAAVSCSLAAESSSRVADQQANVPACLPAYPDQLGGLSYVSMASGLQEPPAPQSLQHRAETGTLPGASEPTQPESNE